MGRQSSSSRGSHPAWETGPGLRVTPAHTQFFLSGPVSTLWAERGMVGLLLRVNNCASLLRTEGPPPPHPKDQESLPNLKLPLHLQDLEKISACL